ncbi:hypothetical protein GZH46_00165, partial [Fragariocoptes setiger]
VVGLGAYYRLELSIKLNLYHLLGSSTRNGNWSKESLIDATEDRIAFISNKSHDHNNNIDNKSDKLRGNSLNRSKASTVCTESEPKLEPESKPEQLKNQLSSNVDFEIGKTVSDVVETKQTKQNDDHDMSRRFGSSNLSPASRHALSDQQQHHQDPNRTSSDREHQVDIDDDSQDIMLALFVIDNDRQTSDRVSALQIHLRRPLMRLANLADIKHQRRRSRCDDSVQPESVTVIDTNDNHKVIVAGNSLDCLVPVDMQLTSMQNAPYGTISLKAYVALRDKHRLPLLVSVVNVPLSNSP